MKIPPLITVLLFFVAYFVTGFVVMNVQRTYPVTHPWLGYLFGAVALVMVVRWLFRRSGLSIDDVINSFSGPLLFVVKIAGLVGLGLLALYMESVFPFTEPWPSDIAGSVILFCIGYWLFRRRDNIVDLFSGEPLDEDPFESTYGSGDAFSEVMFGSSNDDRT